jgi:hypothetical protein
MSKLEGFLFLIGVYGLLTVIAILVYNVFNQGDDNEH